MENYFGPSENWERTREMEFIEALGDTTIRLEEQKPPQPVFLQDRIFTYWINYSHRFGYDVRKYVKNFPMSLGSMPTTTYHDKVPKIKQEIVEDEHAEGKKVSIQRI